MPGIVINSTSHVPEGKYQLGISGYCKVLDILGYLGPFNTRQEINIQCDVGHRNEQKSALFLQGNTSLSLATLT